MNIFVNVPGRHNSNLNRGMPVTTRSVADKSDEKANGQEPDAIMATAAQKPKPKDPTIQDILDSISKLEVKLDGKLDEQVRTLKENQDEAFKKVETKFVNFEQDLSNQADAMSILQKQCDTQRATIDKLVECLDSMEKRQKKHNMIIEGVKEKQNENLRLIIDEMLEDMGVSFNVEWVDCIYRVGPKKQGIDRRPIMINFPFLSYKHEIFRNIYKLKDNQKWRGVYLQDDLTLAEQSKKKETRAIYAYAKSKGVDVKMRGSQLIIDGVKYSYGEDLPHDLSIENAKSVVVKDGLAFQSGHSPYSNLRKCKFRYEGKDYHSYEQALQVKHATVCKQTHVAEKILKTEDPQECMRLGNKLGEELDSLRDYYIRSENEQKGKKLRRRLKTLSFYRTPEGKTCWHHFKKVS